ncbi:MAG: ABC transporter ATP-binding protein [Pseudomonadota bacterium]
MLELQGVSAWYGSTNILSDVSFTVEQGERLGLFGPNGHGKTTILRTISGLMRKRAGHVRFEEKDISKLKPEAIARHKLIHVPQASTLLPELTVSENLSLAARAQKKDGKSEERLAFVEQLFPRVAERRNQRCKTLSGGERQMVAIGIALMAGPRLLMLDEPTLGLSPRLKGELAEAIDQIAATGLTLIVVEQDLQFLLDLTSKLIMIEMGEIKLELDTSDGIEQDEILDHYFGRHASS